MIVCEKEENIKIFSGKKLDFVESIFLKQRVSAFAGKKVFFHDLTIIEHAPNAYQIYFRIEVRPDESVNTILMLEVFTEDPIVFIHTFDVKKEINFKLWAQAKGQYISLRFEGH